MRRKSLGFLLPLLALLAALPPSAAGSPLLTEMGAAVPVGGTIRAANTGFLIRTTSIGNMACSTSVMHGNVVANSGTQLEIEFSSVSFGDCTGFQNEGWEAKNLPWCWRATSKMTADTFELRGGKCSEAAKPITVVIGGGCAYTRAAVTGTFKTSPEDVTLVIAEQEFVGELGGFCNNAFRIDVQYTMTTATGALLAIS
jgi:hypothetical protein